MSLGFFARFLVDVGMKWQLLDAVYPCLFTPTSLIGDPARISEKGHVIVPVDHRVDVGVGLMPVECG